MKRLCFVVLATMFLVSFGFANENIAIVKKVSGDVFVKNKNQKVKLGHKIYENDIIQTSKDGNVQIIFNDGSLITLGKDSLLVIDKFIFKPLKEEFAFDLNLQKGTTVFESGKIGKLAPEKFQMEVPQGIIGIRGTKFLVDLE